MQSTTVGDWRAAIGAWRLWTALGREDIVDRYRRTSLGAAWIAVSFALFVGVKVSVFGSMIPTALADYGLFVAIGFGLWTFISAVVLDGCTTYTQARPWILGTSTPYPVYIYQVVFRNLIIFAVIGVVMLAFLAWKQDTWSPAMLWSLLALPVYLVTPLWLTAILAPLCARYPDAHQVVQTAIRLMFFVTPILWMPEINEHLARLASLNPLTHFIEIVREPLLYHRLPRESWQWVLAVTCIGLPAGFITYRRTRFDVVYWL